MTEPRRYAGIKYVIGPDGSPLTVADLPAPGGAGSFAARPRSWPPFVEGCSLSKKHAADMI
jgi:hypothetical protein